MGQEHDTAKKADMSRDAPDSPGPDVKSAFQPSGAGNLALQDYYQSGGQLSAIAPLAGNLALQPLVCEPEPPSVCTPIPENPLARYPFLAFALDNSQLQDLQDTIYRREHLRRGVPFSGPQGLFFAQARLDAFLPPGNDYVSREDLLAVMMPAMLNAALTHDDVEPHIAEIARNETARIFLEPLRNPLVNVELVDPDGKQNLPSHLKFVVDFHEIPDDHGAILPASLNPLSRVSYGLVAASAKVNARQLSEIAFLQARMEWMNADYLKTIVDMKQNPEDYPYLQVVNAQAFVKDLADQVASVARYLWRENQDQQSAVTKLQTSATALQTAVQDALAVAEKLKKDSDPGSLTMGESWDKNAEDIRKARSEDWEEGGLEGVAGAVGNTIGLGANKAVRVLGNIFTGGSMRTTADRTAAYRRGEISYNNYSGFHVGDIVKGAVQDLAIVAPGYGGKLGEAAIGLFGVEKGTAAAFVIEGQTVGFASGTLGAIASDASSRTAAQLAGSPDERMYQLSQIGGWESWLQSGAEGAAFGQLLGAARAALPRPTALAGRPPQPAGPEPVETGEAADPAATSSSVASLVSTAEPVSVAEPYPASVEEPSSVSPTKPPSGAAAWLKRNALYKITQAVLYGAEPLREVAGDAGRAQGAISEPLGPTTADLDALAKQLVPVAQEQLLSVVEEPEPLVATQPAEAPPAAVGPVADVQVTEAVPEPAPAQVTPASAAAPSFELSSQGQIPAAGTRITTREERKEQEGARRWGMAVDQLMAQPVAGAVAQDTAAARVEQPDATTVALQGLIQTAINDVRTSLPRPAGNAAFGTRLHAALARRLRAAQLPVQMHTEIEQALSRFNPLPQALSSFANLSPRIQAMTVQQWLQSDGAAHAWLAGSLPSSVLNTTIGNLRVDAAFSVGDHSVIFDLTSRERETHLAKTILYALLLSQEGKITRVQEYYWVRWRWRGQ